jgi:signal transduction histidine kinase
MREDDPAGPSINQPLSYVLSSLGMARRSLLRLCAAQGDPALFHLLKWVEAASAGAEHIARIQDPRPDAPVDLVRVLRQTASMVEIEAQRRARLTLDGPADAWVISSEMRLAQLFFDLIVNAMLAVPEGRPDAHEILVRVRGEKPGVVMVEVQRRPDGTLQRVVLPRAEAP